MTSRLAHAIARSAVALSLLAERVGVEPVQLFDAAALARLPLRSLISVAETVNYPIQELFVRANDQPQPDDDAAAVGACLGDQNQGVTRDTLARAPGTSTESRPPCGTSTSNSPPSGFASKSTDQPSE